LDVWYVDHPGLHRFHQRASCDPGASPESETSEPTDRDSRGSQSRARWLILLTLFSNEHTTYRSRRFYERLLY